MLENLDNQIQTEPIAEPIAEATPTPTTEEVATPQAEPTLYELKHNKEVKKVTMDELIATAQKGLDYDRVRPSHEFLKKLAQQNGQSDVSEFMKTVEQNMVNSELQERIEEYTALGMPDDVAKRKVEREIVSERKQPIEVVPQEKPQEDYTELNKIKAEFPTIFQGDKVVLPDGALKLINDKVTDNPLEALRLNKLAEQQKVIDGFKAKESATSANLVNAAASIGSVASGTAQEKDFYSRDDFDKLPRETQQKFIKNGDIFAWQKKW
jgi:hypothetical protein